MLANSFGVKCFDKVIDNGRRCVERSVLFQSGHIKDVGVEGRMIEMLYCLKLK